MASAQKQEVTDLFVKLAGFNNVTSKMVADKAKLDQDKIKMRERAEKVLTRIDELKKLRLEAEVKSAMAGKNSVKADAVVAWADQLGRDTTKAKKELRVITNILMEYVRQAMEMNPSLNVSADGRDTVLDDMNAIMALGRSSLSKKT